MKIKSIILATVLLGSGMGASNLILAESNKHSIVIDENNNNKMFYSDTNYSKVVDSNAKENPGLIDPSDIHVSFDDPTVGGDVPVEWDIDMPSEPIDFVGVGFYSRNDAGTPYMIDQAYVPPELMGEDSENLYIELVDGSTLSDASGKGIFRNLPTNSVFTFQFVVIYNYNSEPYTTYIEDNINVGVDFPLDIVFENLELESSSWDEIKLNYELSMPEPDSNYADTEFEKVEFIAIDPDGNEQLVSTETALSGSTTIDATTLEPNTEYEFMMRTYSNSGRYGITDWKDNTIKVTTSKGKPEQIDSTDIVLTTKIDENDGTIGYVEYDIELPNNPDLDKTTIVDLKLFEDGVEVSSNIDYPNNISSDNGVITLNDLELNSTHSYTLKVKTNVSDEYIESEPVELIVPKGDAFEPLIPSIDVEKNDSVSDGTSVDIAYNVKIPKNDDGLYEETNISEITLLNDNKPFESYSHTEADWEKNVVGGYDEITGVFNVTGLEIGDDYNFSLNVESNTGSVKSDEVYYSPENQNPIPIDAPVASIVANDDDRSKIKVLYNIPEWPINDKYNETSILYVSLIDESTNDVFEGSTSVTDGKLSGEIEVTGLEDGVDYNFVVRAYTNTNNPEGYVDSNSMKYSWDMPIAQEIDENAATLEIDSEATNQTKTTLHYDVEEIIPDTHYIETKIQKVTLLNHGKEYISDDITTRVDGEWSGDFELTTLTNYTNYQFSVRVETNANTIESNVVEISNGDSLYIDRIGNLVYDDSDTTLSFEADISGNKDLLRAKYDGKELKDITSIEESVNADSGLTRVTYKIKLKYNTKYDINNFIFSIDGGIRYNTSFDFKTLTSGNVAMEGFANADQDSYDIATDGFVYDNDEQTQYKIIEVDADAADTYNTRDSKKIVKVLDTLTGNENDIFIKTGANPVLKILLWILIILAILLIIGLLILLILLITRRWKAEANYIYKEDGDLLFVLNRKTSKEHKRTSNSKLFVINKNAPNDELDYSIITDENGKINLRVTGLPIENDNYKFLLKNDKKNTKIDAKVKLKKKDIKEVLDNQRHEDRRTKIFLDLVDDNTI